jgi:hypothetical protein
MLPANLRLSLRAFAIRVARLNGAETPAEGVLTLVGGALALILYAGLAYAAWAAFAI